MIHCSLLLSQKVQNCEELPSALRPGSGSLTSSMDELIPYSEALALASPSWAIPESTTGLAQLSPSLGFAEMQ